MYLHNLLNVLAQIANKMRLQKKYSTNQSFYSILYAARVVSRKVGVKFFPEFIYFFPPTTVSALAEVRPEQLSNT
jgi:hypothetical protein